MPFSVLDPTRDLVLYSGTKYLGGHSDVIGGIACGPLGRINRVWEKVTAYGCCLDAEAAYDLERGLKTLHVRMERHNQNLLEVYEYLTDVSKKFEIKMFHPLSGDYSIPDFAKTVVGRGKLGGMITFNINGKEEKDGIRLMKILHRTGVIKHATSLGGVESLISMPYNMSQSTWAQQELLGLKKYRCLLRFSIGIEDVKDIIGALDQGLAEICK
jgi:cystathionine beta-lyase/cystathionine gamma-synthase